MATFLIDSNCLVAAVSAWHVHHSRATAAINSRLDAEYDLIIAGHSLAESYATLTGLPAPFRISSAEALVLLEQGLVPRATIVVLDPAGYSTLLRRMAREGVVGGRIYDAVIAACARAGGADELLTFNERHFRQFEGDGLRVVVP